jgi:hypothetical protein
MIISAHGAWLVAAWSTTPKRWEAVGMIDASAGIDVHAVEVLRHGCFSAVNALHVEEDAAASCSDLS